MRIVCGLFALGLAFASQAAPRVAVTDLAYEERVREYVRVVEAGSQMQANGMTANANSHYSDVAGTYSYLEQGELKRFTGDIKGEIIKSGQFQLIQGKPHDSANAALHDIVARIKGGAFSGADYVLFGTLSDLDFQQNVNALAHTDSYSAVYGLTLVADFSLIDTRTLQITSAFTAMGEAQDVKLVNSQDVRITPNRGRVVREVSRALGQDVAQQLQEQLLGVSAEYSGSGIPHGQLPPDEPPRILR